MRHANSGLPSVVTRASTATPVAPLLPEEALPSSAQAVQWANPAGDGFFRCAQNIITYLQFVCPL